MLMTDEQYHYFLCYFPLKVVIFYIVLTQIPVWLSITQNLSFSIVL